MIRVSFTDYQDYCKKYWKKGNDETTFALGLGGETGEVLEVLKKARRDGKPVDMNHLEEELGDVLWYVANLCNAYGLKMEEVILSNINKLEKRYNSNERKD